MLSTVVSCRQDLFSYYKSKCMLKVIVEEEMWENININVKRKTKLLQNTVQHII